MHRKANYLARMSARTQTILDLIELHQSAVAANKGFELHDELAILKSAIASIRTGVSPCHEGEARSQYRARTRICSIVDRCGGTSGPELKSDLSVLRSCISFFTFSVEGLRGFFKMFELCSTPLATGR